MSQLYNNDCLEELLNIADESIDFVITDPPYFINKFKQDWTLNKNTIYVNSHVSHLPKGMKYEKKQAKELYDFYLKVSQLIFQKLKPGGFFLSFSSPRLYHSIAMACEISGFEVRDMINWIYTQTLPKAISMNHIIDNLKVNDEEKDNIKKKYENFKTPMLKSCFEPICVAMKPIYKTFLTNELKYNTGLLDFSHKVGKGKNKMPSNIITTEEFDPIYDKNFLVSKPTKKEKGEYNTHLTVKPVQLLLHLIKIFSKENSIILDPFMGSGSTGVACKQLNRYFIGIEINKEYFDIAVKRLSE